jgi:peptidoglycan hydrolase FlgJ
MTGPVTSSTALASAPTQGAATPAAASPEMAKLKKAAQGFEAVFVRQMLSSMRTASLGDGILDSDATQQFRDMGDSKLADTMAEKGGLGIADMLVKQWGARIAGTHPADAPASAPSADAKAAK